MWYILSAYRASLARATLRHGPFCYACLKSLLGFLHVLRGSSYPIHLYNIAGFCHFSPLLFITLLFQMFTHLLDRPLMDDEKFMLSHLSPVGIAKINTDICRCIPFETTLEDLKVAFQGRQKRYLLVPGHPTL